MSRASETAKKLFCARMGDVAIGSWRREDDAGGRLSQCRLSTTRILGGCKLVYRRRCRDGDMM
jgi:hypothetical protein